jgi:hypothetical protein
MLHTCGYWKGVFMELESLTRLQNFTQEMPVEPESFKVLDIDLATGLAKLDELIDQRKADAVALRYRNTPLVWLEPQACAEPLRWLYVRNMLVQRFSYDFLNLLPDDHVSLLNMRPESRLHIFSGPVASSTAALSDKS